MEDNVVNLVISVDGLSPILGLRRVIREEGQHIREVRDVAHGLLAVDVDGLRLRCADRLERLDLAVVEASWLTVRLQAHGLWVDAVQLCEGANRLVPHLSPLRGCHTGNCWVFDDAPVQELHNVEGRADDAVIFAQTVDLRDRDVGVLQRVQNPMLALDLVRRLGEQFSWWFLAHYILVACGGSELVGWI